jgi:hypothetical protein
VEPELKAMLTETIEHASYAGQDQYGKPLYGGAITRPARIQYKVRTVRTAQGQERTSETQVICDGDFDITVRDKITFPDGTSPAIQAVYSPRDPFVADVIDHHEILL